MPKREWVGIPDNAIVLSQSTVSSLELSPCRVTTIPKGVTPPISEAMFSGTAGHFGPEAIMNGEVSPLTARSTHWIVEQAERMLADEPGWDGTLSALVGDVLDWATKISRITEAWIGEVWPWVQGCQIVEVEQPRWRVLGEAQISGRPIVVVTGGIDLIVRHPDLGPIGIDWKTTSSPWKAGDGKASIQHPLYSWLAEPDHGFIEDWIYWVGDFRNYRWNQFPAGVTRESQLQALVRTEGWANFLDLPDDMRPHLCTPLNFKQRGWHAKPQYNHGFCPTCRHLGDEWDGRWPVPDGSEDTGN